MQKCAEQNTNINVFFCVYFLISDVMESRYKMDRLPVDNLIRGQQRKLRAQQKKTNSS